MLAQAREGVVGGDTRKLASFADHSCPHSQSRVYADANERMGKAWWDYGACTSLLESSTVGRRVGDARLGSARRSQRHELLAELIAAYAPC